MFQFLLTGILKDNGVIDNEASLKRIAEVALGYALAGKEHFRLLWDCP